MLASALFNGVFEVVSHDFPKADARVYIKQGASPINPSGNSDICFIVFLRILTAILNADKCEHINAPKYTIIEAIAIHIPQNKYLKY